MRIISGKYKGRTIRMPKGIRPTQNKIRKALFDILGDVEGLSVLELFAGSGAVGFEAVSKGAAELTLVEYNSDCLMAIRKNIESLQLKACELYPRQAEDAIEAFCKNGRKFDIIFLDPPYYRPEGHGLASDSQSHKDMMSKKILQILGACDILARNGFVVVQHFKKEELPKESGNLVLIKESRYGDTSLSFFKKK